MIELLDFDITATGSQQVPVTAEPQAIYFKSVCMTGNTPANHLYDAWGFWSRGTGGDRQCAQGTMMTDLTVASNPHSIGSTSHVLRMHDHSNNQLSVSVTAADASNLTINSTGALATAGVRVIALSISGLEDAWCGQHQIGTYPILFSTGFQPDFAFFTQAAAIPNDPVFVSTNAAQQIFGAMNATKQAGISIFNNVTGGNLANAGQAAVDGDLAYWMIDAELYEQFYGEFQATGFEVKGRSGQEKTSGVQTHMVLCLKGTDSTIETQTTPSGTINHNFNHAPEALIIAGSGNEMWNKDERNNITTAFGQTSQTFSVPGTPPTSISLNSGRASTSTRQTYRNNMSDGACWGLEGGATPSTPTNKYRGEVTQFADQAAETSWTLDGSGAPTAAFPFVLIALGTKAGVTPGAGGFVPFGPGVFR